MESIVKMNAIKDNIVVVFLGAVVVAFVAGVGTYPFILKTAELDVVRKGSYVLKADLRWRVLTPEATREIVRLIEVGETLKTDDSRIHAWLLESRTFVHELGLEKDSEWKGRKVSNAEQNMLWAIEDPSLELQVQKTLGVFRGLRAAFSSTVP